MSPSIKWYGYLILIIYSYISFRLVEELFKKSWYRFNLIQAITEEELCFKWGSHPDDSLLVPFNEISKIILIKDKSKPYADLLFYSEHTNFTKEYLFLVDEDTGLLKFEQVKDAEYLLKLIQSSISESQNIEFPAEPKESRSIKKRDLQVLQNKFNFGFAFLLMGLGVYTALNILDQNILSSKTEEDKITSTITRKNDASHIKTLVTSYGYHIDLSAKGKFINKEIIFSVSPIFKTTDLIEIKHSNYRKEKFEPHRNIHLFSKIFCMIISIFSACYLIYKRGDIPGVDLSFFILFPIFLFIVAFWIFTK